MDTGLKRWWRSDDALLHIGIVVASARPFGLGVAVALLLVLSACASQPAVSECSWVKPILVSRADVLTPGTAGQIVAHNRKWEEFCDAP